MTLLIPPSRCYDATKLAVVGVVASIAGEKNKATRELDREDALGEDVNQFMPNIIMFS